MKTILGLGLLVIALAKKKGIHLSGVDVIRTLIASFLGFIPGGQLFGLIVQLFESHGARDRSVEERARVEEMKRNIEENEPGGLAGYIEELSLGPLTSARNMTEAIEARSQLHNLLTYYAPDDEETQGELFALLEASGIGPQTRVERADRWLKQRGYTRRRLPLGRYGVELYGSLNTLACCEFSGVQLFN